MKHAVFHSGEGGALVTDREASRRRCLAPGLIPDARRDSVGPRRGARDQASHETRRVTGPGESRDQASHGTRRVTGPGESREQASHGTRRVTGAGESRDQASHETRRVTGPGAPRGPPMCLNVCACECVCVCACMHACVCARVRVIQSVGLYYTTALH
jgi:hypothetical protein